MMELSVIVPVYNASSYIKRCIDSILRQTFQEFELIVVNDGSTDNSLDILRSILPQKENIKLYSQSNQGVSATRNYGISLSKGKYVTFIDSDDYIEPSFIETLLATISEEKYDLVMSGTSYRQDGLEIKTVTFSNDVWTTEELADKYNYIDSTTSIHGKLYKKEIIDKYNLKFDTSMSFAEDRDFNIEFIKHIHSAKNISYAGYIYCTDIPDSLSKKSYQYKFKNDCIYWDKVSSLNHSNEFNTYTANRLFHSIVDNINEMLNIYGLSKTLNIVNKDRRNLNGEIINKYISAIKAPKWQVYGIKYNIPLYCMIYSIRKTFSR